LDALSNPNRELEIGAADLRKLIDRVAARLEAHAASLDAQPASSEGPPPTIDEGVPDKPGELDDVLDQLFAQVIPWGYNTTSPGFLGYFGGGGIGQAAVADLIAGTVNRFTGRWAAAPAAVRLELNVTRWFAEMVGYPTSALGILTSGGSMSNLTAFFTARQSRLAGKDLARARFYASDQAHFSMRKAAMICGLPREALREVPSDDQSRMNVSALVELVRQDREQGNHPFLVVATAGTFSTGAVDDIEAIASVARDENMWLHLDGAYGGFFVLTRNGGKILRGMNRCDSVTLDPHKTLFLPYGTGALLVRDGRLLKQAHAVDADFYGPLQEDAACVDLCCHSMEQTRAWRGLRVWLPLKLHGIEPFRSNLEEKLALTAYAAEELRQIPGIELVNAPTLSVLAFRLVQADLSAAELDDLNREFLERINRRKTIFLMGMTIKRKYALRICILSFRTHIDRVRAGLADIRETACELERERKPNAERQASAKVREWHHGHDGAHIGHSRAHAGIVGADYGADTAEQSRPGAYDQAN
jgi:aromatic-L-amino-acid/L-tryptophan decarboxylase